MILITRSSAITFFLKLQKAAIFIIVVMFIKNRKFEYYTKDEFIEYLRRNPVSFIRWGDGESKVFYGSGRSYQKASMKLTKDIRNLYREVKKDPKKSYILGAPIEKISKTNLQLFKSRTKSGGRELINWYHSIFLFSRIKDYKFGDSFIFRSQTFSVVDALSIINDKVLVIVTGDFTRFKPLIDSIHDVDKIILHEINPQNSYEDLDTIVSELTTIPIEYNLLNENLRFMISAGPAAKIIVRKLLDSRLVAYDVGKISFSHTSV